LVIDRVAEVELRSGMRYTDTDLVVFYGLGVTAFCFCFFLGANLLGLTSLKG